MKKHGFLLCSILLIAMFATQAQAFDGERKGFMLNLGAGVGQGKLKISDSNNSLTEDGTGFSADFKIGAGLHFSGKAMDDCRRAIIQAGKVLVAAIFYRF